MPFSDSVIFGMTRARNIHECLGTVLPNFPSVSNHSCLRRGCQRHYWQRFHRGLWLVFFCVPMEGNGWLCRLIQIPEECMKWRYSSWTSCLTERKRWFQYGTWSHFCQYYCYTEHLFTKSLSLLSKLACLLILLKFSMLSLRGSR